MWYINSLYPALSFSWRKEQGRDVEVSRLTEGGTFSFVFGRFVSFLPMMTVSGEMATT